jgi:type II secretory pathway pseudopilin PulG
MERSVRHPRRPTDSGASLVEAVVGMCIAAILASLAAPVTASALDEGRARHAASFLAARLREARQQAVTRSRATGLVFDAVGDRWIFRVCTDGNGDGLRRADLRAGIDGCAGASDDLAVLFPGVTVAVDGTIRGPDDDPPTSDPVRLGSSDIASFSPAGGCTSGSIFLRSSKGAQYAVRIAGITGRMRVLRYDTGIREWSEP